MPLSGAVSVEVTMRADAAGSPNYWVNRWEVSQVANGTFGSPEAVATAFSAFHRDNLLSAFWVDSVRLSTYAPDGQPYNPDTLYVLPVNARGLRVGQEAETSAMPLTNVLHVRKLCASGRLGHLFLRGFLTEADIQSSPGTGGVSLVSTPILTSQLGTQFAAINTALPTGAKVALISGEGLVLSARDVTGLSVAGLASRAFRTRRKTRLVSNAAVSLRSIISDGAVSLQEAPQAISDILTILRALGDNAPLLLP